MDIYKHVCKHIIIPFWAKWERTDYLEKLSYMEKSQFFTEDKIKSIQFDKIKKILNHSYNSCEYYKSRFNKAGITPNEIKTFDDYLMIPVLKKVNYKKRLWNL